MYCIYSAYYYIKRVSSLGTHVNDQTFYHTIKIECTGLNYFLFVNFQICYTTVWTISTFTTRSLNFACGISQM